MGQLVVGSDLAIRHGAIVDINGRVLHQYHSTLGLLSSVDDLWETARACANRTPGRSIVALDWDRRIASWGDNPEVGTLITMVVSFYSALCRIKGCTVVFVTPAIIRVCLGLGEHESKMDVHFSVRNFCPKFENDPEGDLLDAWLLAWTHSCSQGFWS